MKKVLIITYYWPPAGGPGVQRWLKFSTYLPQLGYEPVVYIPENPTYPIVDENLLDQVPDVTIVKRPIFEPYRLAGMLGGKSVGKISSGIIPVKSKQSFFQKAALWIRGNLFIPDARKFWVKPSVKFLQKYLVENSIDTVITSGPPHSLHLIGLRLKQQNPKLRWLADFRDPWTTIGYQKELKLSSASQKKHQELERTVLQSADDIIVTSPLTKSEFQSKTNRPIHVVTNGYDLQPNVSSVIGGKFTVSHIGSLLSQRNPRALWQALSELTRELPGFADDFRLQLVGAVSQEVIDTLDEFRLRQFVDMPGYVSHQQAVGYQRESQLLLLIEIDSEITKSIIPGKVFEYIASGRPILAIGPKGSDFAGIIDETKTGIFATYDGSDKIKSFLAYSYQSYKSGSLTVSAVGIEKYSRKNLTVQLAAVLDHGNSR